MKKSLIRLIFSLLIVQYPFNFLKAEENEKPIDIKVAPKILPTNSVEKIDLIIDDETQLNLIKQYFDNDQPDKMLEVLKTVNIVNPKYNDLVNYYFSIGHYRKAMKLCYDKKNYLDCEKNIFEFKKYS